MIAGSDAYRQQWLTVIEGRSGTRAVELIESFRDLILRADIETIVLDVPIGLMDQGERACDVLARRLVGSRRSSIFPAPIRPMLPSVNYSDACRRRYGVDGKKCSKQLFAILGLIRDVDSQVTPDLQIRVREGHPEVSFALLNGARPLKWPKKAAEGRLERVALLEPHFPDIRERVDHLSHPGRVADLLDAHAMLWTARRITAGKALHLPDQPQYDRRGLRAEIVA